MTKSELSDCGLIWNTSKNSVCLESKPNNCDIISKTLYNMIDVHDFLTRMMTREIKLTKVEMEAYPMTRYPEIYVEYFIPTCTTVTGVLETPKNISIDTCSTCSKDDTLDYLKREMKKQFTEELERAKIKEETVLEFKEISW